MLHKALYSGHNDHNYFEIAHTITYVGGMVGNKLNLYSFVDNHDVERIYTKLNNKKHFLPVHVMLYTLPGIPSIYYGSEFGIEGRKERHSDASLRPTLIYEDYKNTIENNEYTKLIAALGKIYQNTPALCYGDYKQLLLQTTHFAYARQLDGKSVIITVNNADNEVFMELPAGNTTEYVGALTGERVKVYNGIIQVKVAGNGGEIWLPTEIYKNSFEPIKTVKIEEMSVMEVEMTKNDEIESLEVVKGVNITKEDSIADEKKVVIDWCKSYEDMSVEELQEVILEKMRHNGPITEYMLGTVRENIHHGSLVNWAKSF